MTSHEPTTSERFDEAAADFARLRPLLWDPVARSTLAVSRPSARERVLDACCGDGASALPTAEAVGIGGRVDAVDVSAGLLETLRHRARATPWLRCHHQDLMTWAPAERYDLVQCVLGVFFLPDMAAATRHLVGLTRPGGRIAITIWRRGAIEPLGAALREALGARRRRPGPPSLPSSRG